MSGRLSTRHVMKLCRLLARRLCSVHTTPVTKESESLIIFLPLQLCGNEVEVEYSNEAFPNPSTHFSHVGSSLCELFEDQLGESVPTIFLSFDILSSATLGWVRTVHNKSTRFYKTLRQLCLLPYFMMPYYHSVLIIAAILLRRLIANCEDGLKVNMWNYE